MKVKIIKSEGVQKLVVDEPAINDACKHGSPITLAVITNYFNSGCWSFEDYRLKDHLIASKYLNDSNEHIYNFNDYPEADQKLVLSKLHSYTLSDEKGLFYWRFNTVDMNGDIPKDDPRRKLSDGTEYTQCACFTFRAAQAKMREAKAFWESYTGSLTDDAVRIPNPHRQPHSGDYFFELSFNKELLEKARKNKM